MVTYDFHLSIGDNNKGTVYLPSEDSKEIPTIIYCHGWGGNRQLRQPIELLCEKLMAANIAFVTFDFYGCGETGGDYRLMTYTRWKNNLSDIFSWCATQSFANPDKIGCYAFSSGSTAALRFSAEDERVAFVISVGTCISTHIGMRSGNGDPSKIFADNYKELLLGESKEIFGIAFGKEFYIDTISNAPIHTIKKIKCPTLFLQGLADNPYRCADAKMAYQVMKNENLPASYIEIINGNHGLENVIDEATSHAFTWLSSVV